MSKDSSLTLHYNGLHLGFLSCSLILGKATVLGMDKHSSLQVRMSKKKKSFITFFEGATTFSMSVVMLNVLAPL